MSQVSWLGQLSSCSWVQTRLVGLEDAAARLLLATAKAADGICLGNAPVGEPASAILESLHTYALGEATREPSKHRGLEWSPCFRHTARMRAKVNLEEKVGLLEGVYRPGIVGYLNDYKLVVVKLKGEFVWHKHDDTDDFFLVLSGRMTIQLRDKDIELTAGEMFVVPRGVEHCPKADDEAHVLLIEPRGTINTGDAGGALTAPEVEI